MENGTYIKDGNEFTLITNATTGYWVAVDKTTPENILEGQYMGVWTNPVSGVTYYDRTVWVSDLDNAIALGKSQGQLAIWDCENETEVWLNEYFADVFKDEV
jgi:hypothetical protein